MSLLSKLKNLTSITHHSRSDKFNFWKNKITTDYEYGVWTIDNPVTVIDQTTLNSTGGSNACGTYITRSSSSSRYTFKVYIRYGYPAQYSTSQRFYYSMGTSNGSQNLPSSATGALLIKSYTSTTSSIPSAIKSGTVNVLISPYYDSSNNIYYSGVNYSFTYTISSVGSTPTYFTVTYDDLGSDYE